MRRWSTAIAAIALFGITSAGAASLPGEPASSPAVRTGGTTVQAQYYYDPYYEPRYYRYPRYYGYYRNCEEDLGYGRRGNWGCG